jgi:hypothetical protein
MRVFLCAFTGFSVAIPMYSVSSLALYTNEASSSKPFEENQDTCISLPGLLKFPLENIRHSIVMKSNVVLFTTEVECEAEIPDEEIYPLPKIFDRMRFSRLFSGIQLGSNLRLILNPERLAQSIHDKELTV